MKRRSFLSLLGAAPVAAVLTFKMGLSSPIIVPPEADVIFDKVEGTAVDLVDLAKEMLRLMVRQFNGRRFSAVDHALIGEGNLVHQSSISLNPRLEQRDDALEAGARQLCEQVLAKRATTFGTLHLPVGIEGGVTMRDESGVVLRAVRDYDIMSDRYLVRVDVLYG